ncbi:MAG: NAD-dependent epimerase/dehydratase family protein [Rhodobacteraceae bacterium]|nr:NAD-dependent epimerase/dehydratase family protein [Paracoccaceae bacterium]
MSDRHVFITGANGYVGRNLVQHFVAAGCAVTGLVRHEEAARQIAALGARPMLGDMMDADLADRMTGCDALVHAAACLDHGPGAAAQAANREGTRNVMTAALRAGLRRAVHISSDSVLQDGRPLRQVTEDHPLPRRPAGAYSAGKAEAEAIALAAARDGLGLVILRPRMVWGRDDTTALPTLARMVREGRFAWISGGSYPCSTTHVANLCHAVDLALGSRISGAVYHIADGPARPFRETVTGLLATQRLTPPDKSVPRPLLRGMARLGDALFRLSGGRLRGPLSFQEYATSAVEISLDTSRAERDLGYAPIIGWEEGLEDLRARSQGTAAKAA